MKLKIENGIIVVDNANGTYTVPSDVPNPLMIQRFRISGSEIIQHNDYIGLNNSQVRQAITSESLDVEFREDVGTLMSSLISVISSKLKEVEKEVIGKAQITDSELEKIKYSYTRKYELAMSGDFTGKLVYQAEALGMTEAQFAAFVIQKRGQMNTAVDLAFDALEAERIKIQKLITTRENGLTEAKDALELLTSRDGRFWVNFVSPQ